MEHGPFWAYDGLLDLFCLKRVDYEAQRVFETNCSRRGWAFRLLGQPPTGDAATSHRDTHKDQSNTPVGGFNVERARRDTPGSLRVAHFNHAGASPLPRPVLDAVQAHLRLEAEIGGYEAAEARASELKRTYQALARLLCCEADEVALVENATRGWDMAFYSLRFKPGDRILTSNSEYGSNYIAYLQVAQRTGAVVEVLPDDDHGQVSVEALRKALAQGRVGLVGLTHIPMNGGLVNPVEEVGRLTREAGVPFLLDASQAAGQWPLDVNRIGCDMLAGTGRKFLRGPRGTGSYMPVGR
jgi:cysteine desulfurase / selenocysteine lyase